MDIRPIRTEADYQAALKEIESLMDAESGTPEEDKLDILAALVEDYEEKHHPIPPPNPIGALEHYLESRGLTAKALEPYIGSRSRVWEIMNRKRRLSLEMIRRLEKGTGIPASILIQSYELDLADPEKVTESP